MMDQGTSPPCEIILLKHRDFEPSLCEARRGGYSTDAGA